MAKAPAIPRPTVPFLDQGRNTVSREWYLFLANIFASQNVDLGFTGDDVFNDEFTSTLVEPDLSLDPTLLAWLNLEPDVVASATASTLPTFTTPAEAGGSYMWVTVNPNSQLYPSGSFLTSTGGTLNQVVETPPTTWSSKLQRISLDSSSASVSCGYKVTTNANSGPNLAAAGSSRGGFTFGVLFGTHGTNELTATTSKFIGASSFTGFSTDPTGGNWSNNANFNTGSAFGMFSNQGDTNWKFMHKSNAAASMVTDLGIARASNQYFSFLARSVIGQSTTRIVITQLDASTGAQTSVMNTSVALNTESNIYLQPFFVAAGTTAVARSLIFQRAFLYIPDSAFPIS